jgi:hypothetical protein
MLSLIQWIADIRNLLVYWLQDAFREVVKFTTAHWGIVLIFAALAWGAMDIATSGFIVLLSIVNGLASDSFSLTPPTELLNVLAIANTFTPLQEFFVYLIGYLTLLGGLTLYRIVKSWIPTVPSA